MPRKRGKKGQSGGSAAGLIAVIGLLIVLYIILIPPDERKKLLEDEVEGSQSTSTVEDNLTFLLEHPGRLDYQQFNEYDHDISPVFLYSTENSKELKTAGSFYVKNGVFDKKFYTLDFKIDDVANTDDLMLSFVAEKHKGILTIKLNGKTAFEEEIKSSNPSPIKIPKEYVASQNTLEFFVSSVGWKFWSTNEYSITNFKIIGEVTDTSRQESKNIFMLSEFEYRNLDTVTLKFNPECRPNDVGLLEIRVNNHNIFSGIPDCGILNKKYFSIGYLNAGENDILFTTRKGSYLIDNIIVKTELKKFEYPTYSFELNQSIFDDITAGNLTLFLDLSFFNDKNLKQADIFINGHRIAMSTFEKSWTRNINNYVDYDYNSFKIVPDNSNFDIIELKVSTSDEKD
ncbi:hypothetical protein JXA85_08280 [Candidatus Woesearchaeota archaeon]|nr:hypothetical protein [Candidatus Woesearchaeota archaeon]